MFLARTGIIVADIFVSERSDILAKKRNKFLGTSEKLKNR